MFCDDDDDDGWKKCGRKVLLLIQSFSFLP